MKKYTVLFWTTTTLIFLFEGVMTALTFNSELGQQGIANLGYPLYFGTMLAIFKILGSIVLIVPKFPKNIKEWAYAGFGIDFIAAFVSIWVVMGFGIGLLLPIIFMGVLAVSYVSWKKLG
jgi:hypothetical protein